MKSWRWRGSSSASARLLVRLGLGHDEVLDELAPLAEEHVLGAAQPDALGAEAPGAPGVLRGVGVGAHPQAAAGVRPLDQVGDGGDDLVVARRRRPRSSAPPRSPRRARPRRRPRRWCRRSRRRHPRPASAPPRTVIRRFSRSTSSASTPQTQVRPMPAGDDGRVRGLAAAAGEDPLRHHHAAQVVGVGLLADQDHVVAAVGPLDGGVGVEDHLADRRTGGGVHALRDQLPVRLLVEAREHQLRELGAGDPVQRLVVGRSGPPRPSAPRSGTPPPGCACRPGSAASTACRARS